MGLPAPRPLEVPTPPREPEPPPERAFGALRHRNFRVFYLGHLLSLVGQWMQTTAQGWLVLELTDSSLLLGVVTAAGSLPSLFFTLWAGVIADRVDKRRIIMRAQAASLVLALTLAVLTDAERITYPLLLALVLLLGTATAFEVPTRQSFFAELVGPRDLPNAIALNSAAFNASRIVGPALAGGVIGAAGIAACFYANAVSYLAVLVGLLLMRLPPFTPPPRTASTAEHLREGLAFIRGDRLVRTLVWTIAGMSVTAFPFAMLLPVFARDVLRVGASGYGWLLAASGAGALSSAIVLAMGLVRVRRGSLLLGASLSFGVFLIGFSLSRSFALSLVLLAGAGFTMILNNATINALLQSVVPHRLRGRVMSVYVFMFVGMTPLGALQAGAVAKWLGAPAAVAIGAAALLLLVLWVAWHVPEVRRAR
ncbi:MAG TPA: MFS transporter [Longimicrobiaceae bacterium]|nr:MFS transporter [Longimicrobiaceae bacterium]